MGLIVYRTRWGERRTRDANSEIHEFRGIESRGVEKRFSSRYFSSISIIAGPAECSVSTNADTIVLSKMEGS